MTDTTAKESDLIIDTIFNTEKTNEIKSNVLSYSS